METLEQEEEPACRPPQPEAEEPAPSLQREVLPPRAKKGFWARLGSCLGALCAGGGQNTKTAQDWRDESRARNPWWGNGI